MIFNGYSLYMTAILENAQQIFKEKTAFLGGTPGSLTGQKGSPLGLFIGTYRTLGIVLGP